MIRTAHSSGTSFVDQFFMVWAPGFPPAIMTSLLTSSWLLTRRQQMPATYYNTTWIWGPARALSYWGPWPVMSAILPYSTLFWPSWGCILLSLSGHGKAATCPTIVRRHQALRCHNSERATPPRTRTAPIHCIMVRTSPRSRPDKARAVKGSI